MGLTGSMGLSMHSSGGISPSTVTPATTAGEAWWGFSVGLSWWVWPDLQAGPVSQLQCSSVR
mgnify:CR=1 FL=1